MRKKFEIILFEQHSFLGVFSFILICSLPWWIAFWPGTLQYDSCGQLLQYYGVGPMTGHHPLPVTMVMGFLMDIGRNVFHSDNVGLFLYTGSQFIVQTLVISYGFCVYRRIHAPMWIRWFSLFFYSLFPLVPNWGISYVKDTGYYISFLLYTFVLIDLFLLEETKISKGQCILYLCSLLGLISFRNDGRYVVAITTIAFLIFLKKYWKTYLLGAGTVLLFLILVESVYMPLKEIPSGSIREALSVPLMQTANYLNEYMDEVTPEEKSVLLSVFEINDLQELSNAYDKTISDDVKALFIEYPTQEELLSYLHIWWIQLTKHPTIYFQTYWEHCSGYFVPWEKCYEDIIGWFKMLDGQSRSDEYLDIYFEMKNPSFRTLLEKWSNLLYKTPIIGAIYYTGVHTWILLGSIIYLFYKNRKREILLMVPGLLVLLICTVSPLNASVRYFLPVMTSTPIYIAYCFRKSNQTA